MTELDKELQELRQQVEQQRKLIEELQELHYCDIAEIAYQRRVIDFLMESMEPKKPKKREVCNNCDNLRFNAARSWCAVKNVPVDLTTRCSNWKGIADGNT